MKQIRKDIFDIWDASLIAIYLYRLDFFFFLSFIYNTIHCFSLSIFLSLFFSFFPFQLRIAALDRRMQRVGVQLLSAMLLGYHWDCSDWVRPSQNPLPNITEVPGSEVPDSSSFHSNESNESNTHQLPSGEYATACSQYVAFFRSYQNKLLFRWNGLQLIYVLIEIFFFFLRKIILKEGIESCFPSSTLYITLYIIITIIRDAC